MIVLRGSCILIRSPPRLSGSVLGSNCIDSESRRREKMRSFFAFFIKCTRKCESAFPIGFPRLHIFFLAVWDPRHGSYLTSLFTAVIYPLFSLQILTFFLAVWSDITPHIAIITHKAVGCHWFAKTFTIPIVFANKVCMSQSDN